MSKNINYSTQAKWKWFGVKKYVSSVAQYGNCKIKCAIQVNFVFSSQAVADSWQTEKYFNWNEMNKI